MRTSTRWHRGVGALLAAGLSVILAGSIVGPVALLTTQGTSMAPRFQTGDLAIVREADSYRVGDVVAYRSDLIKKVVLHRIVAVQNGRYTFQGDNNTWIDPEKPGRDHVIGKLALRVPQAGVWVTRLGRPVGLALIAFGLLGALASATRSRRNQGRPSLSRHARAGGGHNPTMSALPPSLRTAMTAVAVAGIASLLLGAFAWSEPKGNVTLHEDKANRQMSFSYTAKVPKSAAYAGTTVRSPQPVFRKLARHVDVRYSYIGEPGQIAVDAELSTPSGWRLTVPLAAPANFVFHRYDGTVRLDLAALENRAQAAADATGMPTDRVTIAVIPTVTTSAAKAFQPSFPLVLTSLQLTTAPGVATTVKDPTVVKTTTMAPRTLELFEREMSIETARTFSVVVLLLSLLGAALLAMLSTILQPGGEVERIRRQYAPLLLRVHPLSNAPGQATIDVPDFAALAKIAERYGLFVMHWSRSGIETFVVQDTSATFRYRTGVAQRQIPREAPDIDVRVPTHRAIAVSLPAETREGE